MQNELYLKLGSGHTRKHQIGSKGSMLDRAKSAGIFVPEGIILLDTVWDQAVLHGLIEINANGVVCPKPTDLYQFLNLPKFENLIAVRSAFSVEDDVTESLAGFFTTVLNVDANDPFKLVDAICQVLGTALKAQTLSTAEFPPISADISTTRLKRVRTFRRNIMLVEMVKAEYAGIAFSERAYEDDLVNFTTGTADKLTAGEIEGESLTLPKLRGWERRPIGIKPGTWQARLQGLLRDVRRWLGTQQDWDVEWADDGKICWLLQARPLTQPTRRNDVFTAANHKEILPPLPSVFITSIVESCAAELFAYYRRFDAALPQNRPLIEIFYGRPYINLSLLSDMMRTFGLPTSLITIGGESKKVVGVNRKRMVAKTLSLTLPRLVLTQLFAAQSARSAAKIIDQRTQHPGKTLAENIETMRWLYNRLVTEVFSLLMALGPVLLILRRLNTLEAHAAGHQTISTQMYTDLEAMQRVIQQHPAAKAQLERGEIPDETEFQGLWEQYLEKYGHRGIYESDLANPRYREDPTPLLAALLSKGYTRESAPAPTLKYWLTYPLWLQARRMIAAREQWRHEVMRGFERVRLGLINAAQPLIEKSVLPSIDHLWMLNLDEIRKLETGWKPNAAFWKQRKAEINKLRAYRLPDLFQRFDDLEQWQEEPPTVDQLKGISLTRGEVSGRAWVLDEPSTNLPEGFIPAQTILIARSVDAGWIPTFMKVAGVVVETGSDLSHGSIILREIGLPAVTNVRYATQWLCTGDELTLRAGVGIVEKNPIYERSDT